MTLCKPRAAHPVLAGEGVEAREELVEKLLRGRGVEQAAGRAVGWLAGGRRTGRWLVAGWWEGGGRVGGRCAAGTHHDLAGREVAAHGGEAADVCRGEAGWLGSVGRSGTWSVGWSVGGHEHRGESDVLVEPQMPAGAGPVVGVGWSVGHMVKVELRRYWHTRS
jgi:hypothetical protein